MEQMDVTVTSQEAERRAPLWAVIPAGGAGTRLWPLSRASKPKFLLPLLGARSLLQQTADRLARVAPLHRTLVVCGPAHAAAIARQLPGLPESHLLVEPSPKGSGPAIALASALVARREPDALVGSFAADHVIQDEDAFAGAVATAGAAGEAGWLTTIGVSPTHPATGYGYVERTDEVVATAAGGNAYRAARFVEKPDAARAAAYLATGRYLWNAGMFVWQPQTLLAELERLQPVLFAGIRRIVAAWDGPERERVTAEVWAGLEPVTIDEGVLERAARVAVVPAAMGWSDVGDWAGLGELVERDPAARGPRGDLIELASRNSTVWSATDRLIALVGCEDLIVVDTPDALLVAHRDQAQDVRAVVNLLAQRERHDLV